MKIIMILFIFFILSSCKNPVSNNDYNELIIEENMDIIEEIEVEKNEEDIILLNNPILLQNIFNNYEYLSNTSPDNIWKMEDETITLQNISENFIRSLFPNIEFSGIWESETGELLQFISGVSPQFRYWDSSNKGTPKVFNSNIYQSQPNLIGTIINYYSRVGTNSYFVVVIDSIITIFIPFEFINCSHRLNDYHLDLFLNGVKFVKRTTINEPIFN